MEEDCEICMKRGKKSGAMRLCELLSTHVHSKELSLLVDGIVNWPGTAKENYGKAAGIGDQRNRDPRAYRPKWKVLPVS